MPRFSSLALTLGDPTLDLQQLLRQALARLQLLLPAISNVAVLVHDPVSDILRPHPADEALEPSGGCRYIPMASRPDLRSLAESQQLAVVDERSAEAWPAGVGDPWPEGGSWHSRLTIPLLRSDLLLGFLLLDADLPAVFQPPALAALAPELERLMLRLCARLGSSADLMAVVNLMARIVAIRDGCTGSHLRRVAAYCRLIGSVLEGQNTLPRGFAEVIARCAPLHDVGKLGVPDRVLLKPGMLDSDETALMRTHVSIGQELVDRLLRSFPPPQGELTALLLRSVVGQHHECLDGSGYPQGLEAEDVNLAGRIVAVADIYDSLTQERPYKQALADRQAVAILRGMVRAGKLDGRCVEALLGEEESRRRIRESGD